MCSCSQLSFLKATILQSLLGKLQSSIFCGSPWLYNYCGLGEVSRFLEFSRSLKFRVAVFIFEEAVTSFSLCWLASGEKYLLSTRDSEAFSDLSYGSACSTLCFLRGTSADLAFSGICMARPGAPSLLLLSLGQWWMPKHVCLIPILLNSAGCLQTLTVIAPGVCVQSVCVHWGVCVQSEPTTGWGCVWVRHMDWLRCPWSSCGGIRRWGLPSSSWVGFLTESLKQ